MNSNLGENIGLTVETGRVISSEISPQMSRKLEERKSDVNTCVLDAINTAIEKRVLTNTKMLLKAKILR